MTISHLLLSVAMCGDIYHVEVDGRDAPDRDGRTRETAFASLAYACEQLPAGKNTIRVGKGAFVCTRPAIVPSNTDIFGNGFHGNGDNFTRLTASPDWELRPNPTDGPLEDESLLVIKKKSSNVTLYGLQFESPEDHRITGGVTMDQGKQIKVDTCRFKEFRWFGLRAVLSENIEVARCSFQRCSTVRDRHRSGQISTKWIKDCSFHHCRIEPAKDGGGYGYKGGGHRGVRIHDNTFMPAYFAIESPHENERGLEIDHNIIQGAISVPKPGPGADPTEEGYKYAVEIHHNVMTDSYAIEGPRNHLRVHHNHIHINKPGGRVYSQFGGTTHGPIRFDHNVIENVDRSIVWIRNGLCENLTFEANTVSAADAPERNGFLFSVWTADHIASWVVQDNVFVAAWNQPRAFSRTDRDVPSKMTVKNNLFINVTDVPDGNTTGVWPSFRRGDAEKPWDYFAPNSESGPTVDAGIRDEETFLGNAPDIGAVEYGATLEPVGPRW